MFHAMPYSVALTGSPSTAQYAGVLRAMISPTPASAVDSTPDNRFRLFCGPPPPLLSSGRGYSATATYSSQEKLTNKPINDSTLSIRNPWTTARLCQRHRKHGLAISQTRGCLHCLRAVAEHEHEHEQRCPFGVLA